MNISIIGMMGSGKSAVGAAVSSKLNFAFIDTDAEIEKKYGKSVKEIFDELGEAEFRLAEKRTVSLINQLDRTVIATGGGAVLDPENVAALQKSSVVVYLKVKPETLGARLGSDASRPLLTGATDLTARISAILRLREPLYEIAADVTVECDGFTVNQTADEALRLIGEFARERELSS